MKQTRLDHPSSSDLGRCVERVSQPPVKGVGAGAYGGGVHELGIARNVPEAEIKTTNLWLETLAELGVLGLTALLAMLVTAVFGLWKTRRREPLATFVITAILASAAMFPFVQTLWVPYRWIVWILAFGLAFPLVARRPRSVERLDDARMPGDAWASQADPTPPDVV